MEEEEEEEETTAAAATTTTSQQLSPSGETPGVPRAGRKYPVRENPSLRLLRYVQSIAFDNDLNYAAAMSFPMWK